MQLANPQRRFVNLFDEYQGVSLGSDQTVTVITTDFLSFPSIDVIIDTFVLIQIMWGALKTGGAGRTAFEIHQSAGTGTLRFMQWRIDVGGSQYPSMDEVYHHAGTVRRMMSSFWLKASASGTATLTLRGVASGSNSTLYATSTRMELFKFL